MPTLSEAPVPVMRCFEAPVEHREQTLAAETAP